MDLIEMIIDGELEGIQAISLVEAPAIEENWVALSEQVQFKAQDQEKRIVMGPALIPDKPIYRRKGEEEFHIFFSKETVREAMELYFKNGRQNTATVEHEVGISSTTVVESWIIEGEQDKSRMYNFDLPVGTWMVSMKIESEPIWEEWVKTGKVKGFSIEGFFKRKSEELSKQAEPTDELTEEGFLNELQRAFAEDIAERYLEAVK
jgi:hypothetical protein